MRSGRGATSDWGCMHTHSTRARRHHLEAAPGQGRHHPKEEEEEKEQVGQNEEEEEGDRERPDRNNLTRAMN